MAKTCSVLVHHVTPEDIYIARVEKDNTVSYHLNIGSEFTLFLENDSAQAIAALGQRIVDLASAFNRADAA